MAKVTIKDLLEAGVHFGHQVKRWNPKMKEFVYGAKNGIYIIELTKTMRQMAAAANFLQRIVGDGGNVLFVGTKRQAQQIVKEVSEKTDMYYVSERWLGGTLTNNVTIRKSITKMVEIDEILESDRVATMKKKEISSLKRQSLRLHRNLDGIFEMTDLPQALVVVDVCHEDIAVKEAKKLGIPVVALVDTNGNPDNIDFPIPANDDAVRSIQIILEVFADAILVASELYAVKAAKEKAADDARKAEEKAAKEKAAKERKEKAEAEKKDKAEKKTTAKKKTTGKKAAPKKDEQADAPAEEEAEEKAAEAGDAKAKEEKKEAAPAEEVAAEEVATEEEAAEEAAPADEKKEAKKTTKKKTTKKTTAKKPAAKEEKSEEEAAEEVAS